MAKLVSKTYGEALFELSMEQDCALAYLDQVKAIRKVLEDNSEFDRLILHPGIPKQEKIDMIGQVFDSQVNGEMAGFLKLVVQKERYSELKSIFRYFEEKVKEVMKIGVAVVTTAVELSDDQKKRVEARLLETTDYKEMEMHYQVDPAIIGGMLIRIGDRVMDSSIRTKLEVLTGQLLQIQLG